MLFDDDDLDLVVNAAPLGFHFYEWYTGPTR